MNWMNFRFLMCLVVTLTAFIWTAAPAQADVLTVSLSPLSDVVSGSTGNGFDVLLTNTSGPAVEVAGFFFEVVTSSSDVTFTDATTASATAYIFGADSLFGPDILGPGSTAADLNASDLDGAGSAALAPGQVLALGRVLFDVSPTALTQTVHFNLVGFPGTSLADAAGGDIPIETLVGGQFTINAAIPPVPEPSTLLLALAVVPLLWSRRKAIR